MNIDRELLRLQERVNRLAIQKSPPALRMIVVNEGNAEVPPDEDELTQWDLVCKIQKKPVNA